MRIRNDSGLCELGGWWLLKATILIGIGGGAGWIFRKHPGNIQAAIWTITLLLIWIVPVAEKIVPVSISLPASKPVTVVVNVKNRPSGNPVKQRTPVHIAEPSRIQSSQNPGINRTETTATLPEIVRNSSENEIPWKKWIGTITILIWFIGAFYSVVGWIRASWQIKRILRKAVPVTDANITSLVERTRQTLFIHEKLRSLCSE